jgi:hypothetical protein
VTDDQRGRDRFVGPVPALPIVLGNSLTYLLGADLQHLGQLAEEVRVDRAV